MMCVYCLLEKSAQDITEEHVVPKQLGRFAHGWPVTIKACRVCNGLFSRELENVLATDSWEAITRFRRKEAGGMRSKQILYDRLSIRATDGGDWHDSAAFYTEEEGRVVVQAQPQVALPGFPNSGWVLLKDLRRMPDDALRGRYDATARIKVIGQPDEIEKLMRELSRLGLELKVQGHLEAPRDKPWLTQTFEMDHRHLRVIAKIAMNYFVAIAGTDVASARYFDHLRAYIKHGTRSLEPIVKVTSGLEREYEREDLSDADTHVLSLKQSGQDLVCVVRLYNDVTYQVRLAGFYRLSQPDLPVAHEYNLTTRTVGAVLVETLGELNERQIASV